MNQLSFTQNEVSRLREWSEGLLGLLMLIMALGIGYEVIVLVWLVTGEPLTTTNVKRQQTSFVKNSP